MQDTQATFPGWCGRITIPATGGVLKTIAQLLADAGCPIASTATVVRITGKKADGSNRGEIWTTVPRPTLPIAATDFTSEGTRWDATEPAYEPCDLFRDFYVAGVAGQIDNVVVVALRS